MWSSFTAMQNRDHRTGQHLNGTHHAEPVFYLDISDPNVSDLKTSTHEKPCMVLTLAVWTNMAIRASIDV